MLLELMFIISDFFFNPKYLVRPFNLTKYCFVFYIHCTFILRNKITNIHDQQLHDNTNAIKKKILAVHS